MNNKDLNLEQKPNSETKDELLPSAIACTKPNVEKHIYTCFQDRYVETRCTNCGKHIFRDI